MRWILIAGALVIAPVAVADEVPDYLGLQGKAERFAQAATSVRSCQHFGFTTAEDALRAFGQRIVDEAEFSGIPGGSADVIVSGAIRQESARQEERGKAINSDESRAAFLEYWRRRCGMLADDEVYSAFFHRP